MFRKEPKAASVGVSAGSRKQPKEAELGDGNEENELNRRGWRSGD